MAKRIEEKFFKCVYDIIEYWAKQEKDNLTGEKFTDKDKIEGAFHSFFTMIEGCSSINDFNYYTIHNKYGKELPNINGYYMYVCFRKFREQLTHQHEEKEKEKEISEVLAKQSITCLNTIEKAYQDKISFAVEQLEKAKSFCISAEDNGWCVTHKNWLEIVEYIDNQIKQLKEKDNG